VPTAAPFHRLTQMSTLDHKYYNEESVFKAENLLREAKRQKNLPDCKVPRICLLDPDGDMLSYLVREGKAQLNECWACYHSKLYSFKLQDQTIGIIPCIVGSSYAVLVAEQLFVSGCEILISITSAGMINGSNTDKRFALITSAIRDEGTSYHYLPPGETSILDEKLSKKLSSDHISPPYTTGISWTTDAPFRETKSAIDAMKRNNVICVEMEAAALYALAAVKKYKIICFTHLTNSMAQQEGDFEKGEEFGSIDSLKLVSYVLDRLDV
jgi:uridine phosphorylase